MNPSSKIHVKQYFEYKNKLSSRQMKTAKEKILKHNANEYFFGDRPTKQFFENFKRKTDPSSKVIFKMKDENGILKYETNEILEIGRQFYKNLFAEKGFRVNQSLKDVFFANVKCLPSEFFGIFQMQGIF